MMAIFGSAASDLDYYEMTNPTPPEGEDCRGCGAHWYQACEEGCTGGAA